MKGKKKNIDNNNVYIATNKEINKKNVSNLKKCKHISVLSSK